LALDPSSLEKILFNLITSNPNHSAQNSERSPTFVQATIDYSPVLILFFAL